MRKQDTYFWWVERAQMSQEISDAKRANPRDWFTYYFERVVCVLFLIGICVAGILAFLQLLVGNSG